jgi:hypothetical protein
MLRLGGDDCKKLAARLYGAVKAMRGEPGARRAGGVN